MGVISTEAARCGAFILVLVAIVSSKQCLINWMITGGGAEFALSLFFQWVWGAVALFGILVSLLGWPWLMLMVFAFIASFQFAVIGYWIYTLRPMPASIIFLHAGEVQQGVHLGGIEWDWHMLWPVLDVPLSVDGVRVMGRVGCLRERRGSVLMATIVALIALAGLGHLHGQAMWISTQSTQRSVRGLGVVGWWMNDGVSKMRMGDQVLQPDLRKVVPPEPEVRRKIVVIQWESLDAGIPYATCGGVLVAPRLNELLKKAWVVPRIRAEHLAGGSSDADAAFCLGISARGDWPVLQSRLYDARLGIGHEFSRRGLRAVAYHNNSGDFFARGDIYPKLGFERFVDPHVMGLPRITWGSPDHLLFPAIFDDWREFGQPDLSFIITLSSHHPFTLPRAYGVDLPEFVSASSEIERAYFQSIWYTDRAIGDFIDRLDLGSTWVVIYGDHCPGIPQNRRDRSVNIVVEGGRHMFKDASLVNANGSLTEYVPLIMAGPLSIAGRTLPGEWQINSHLDIRAISMALSLGE